MVMKVTVILLTLSLDAQSEKEEGIAKEAFEPLVDWLKERLSGVVEGVSVSSRLSSAPIAILPSGMGLTPSQERSMVFQNQGSVQNGMLDFYLTQKRQMEINPNHPLMKKLLEVVVGDEEGKEKYEHVPEALYEIYSISSGYDARSPSIFVERVERVLRLFLGVEMDAQVKETIKPAPKETRAEKKEEKQPFKIKASEFEHEDEL